MHSEVKGNVIVMKIRILYILLGVFIAAVIVSAVGLGRELYINREGQSYYTALADDIQTRPRIPGEYKQPAPSQTTPLTPTPGVTETIVEENIEAPEQEPPQWAPYVDFYSLNETLPGISAWIKLENTVLDYPIMRWTNNSYFLHHLPDGTGHRNGSIFLDYRNAVDFSDKDTLIYGHESKTGDMFGILKSYRRQSFYEENPVIYIFTPEKDYELILVAGYLVDSGVESPPLKFKDDADFMEHVAVIKQRSFFRSDVEVSAGDRLVSLCTCAYDYTNARLVIVGKLVEF